MIILRNGQMFGLTSCRPAQPARDHGPQLAGRLMIARWAFIAIANRSNKPNPRKITNDVEKIINLVNENELQSGAGSLENQSETRLRVRAGGDRLNRICSARADRKILQRGGSRQALLSLRARGALLTFGRRKSRSAPPAPAARRG
jgi:hypothetical protein